MFWYTPFHKQFAIVCCIVGAIWVFIEGFTSTGPTIHGFGDHLILGLLEAALAALCGIYAISLPFVLAGILLVIVMCAAIAGIDMGLRAFLKGFLRR